MPSLEDLETLVEEQEEAKDIASLMTLLSNESSNDDEDDDEKEEKIELLLDAALRLSAEEDNCKVLIDGEYKNVVDAIIRIIVNGVEAENFGIGETGVALVRRLLDSKSSSNVEACKDLFLAKFVESKLFITLMGLTSEETILEQTNLVVNLLGVDSKTRTNILLENNCLEICETSKEFITNERNKKYVVAAVETLKRVWD